MRLTPESVAGLDLLAPHRSLLLAVSGGPDSVALMLLCAKWPGRGERDIAVATVDHGLRRGSRVEAEAVGRWAQALGFPHQLLTWEGEKPRTRIQERARDARYALLLDCARRIGASAIVTAHHADDQAETILFRLTRGSGVTGLAGMPASGRVGGRALLRPLLDLPKSTLVSICQSAGHSYLSDPSNANEDFARVRLRKLMPAIADLGLDRDALLRLADRAARADEALDACAAALRARALTQAGPDGASFDAAALRDAPPELLRRLLALEIARLAPDAQPRFERLERAAAGLGAALQSGDKRRITLAELLLDATPDSLTLRPAPPRRKTGPTARKDSGA
jgi:tRNA(Ile)-lysidine synthase